MFCKDGFSWEDPWDFSDLKRQGKPLTNGERIRIIDDDEKLCGLVRE